MVLEPPIITCFNQNKDFNNNPYFNSEVSFLYVNYTSCKRMNYWLISCLVQCAGERFFSTTQSFYKLFNISHFMMAHQTNKSSNSKLGRAWCSYSRPTPKCNLRSDGSCFEISTSFQPAFQSNQQTHSSSFFNFFYETIYHSTMI